MKPGDLLFSRWNGWDDRIIQACQWLDAHLWRPELLPWCDVTHIQVVGETPGQMYEAAWPRIAQTNDSENVYANGLRWICSVSMVLTDTQRAAAVAYCRARLRRRYSLLRFAAIGLKLLTRLRIPIALRADVCSTYAASATDQPDPRWLCPMELAALVHAPPLEPVTA